MTLCYSDQKSTAMGSLTTRALCRVIFTPDIAETLSQYDPIMCHGNEMTG